jgi:hypothetical protein
VILAEIAEAKSRVILELGHTYQPVNGAVLVVKRSDFRVSGIPGM